MSALESALLGALLNANAPSLMDPQALVDLAGLRSEDFTDLRVRGAWQLAERMALQRRPIDAVTLFAEGKKRKLVADDSLGWLQGLEAGNTLDKAKFADVATNVRTQARRSALSVLLKQQAAELDRGGDLAEVAGTIEGACASVVGFGQTHDVGSSDIREMHDEWEERQLQGRTLLVPTGVRAIDELIGGWVPNLNIIAGLPSVGKSALLGTAVERQLLAGVKVGLFGLEDGTRWLARRLIARDVGVPVRDIGNGTLSAEHQERYVIACQHHSDLLGRLITYRRDSINVDELCRRISYWVNNLGVQCVYVDHGGEVEHRRDNQGDDFRLAVSETYRRLRNLAVRYQVPIVVLAHTTRASDKANAFGGDEQPPKLSEIAESAYIERRARVVLGLWTKATDGESMRVTVLKQTDGKRGDTCRIDRLTTAALLDPDSGTSVNLNAERGAEIAKKREERAAGVAANAKARAEAAAAMKAAKEANKKPKQATLSVVGPAND